MGLVTITFRSGVTVEYPNAYTITETEDRLSFKWKDEDGKERTTTVNLNNVAVWTVPSD